MTLWEYACCMAGFSEFHAGPSKSDPVMTDAEAAYWESSLLGDG